MTPLVRVKTSEGVAEYMVELLFAGEMRSGDRIDLDAIAASLEVSRAPVREALLQLERDGLVTVVYHRGAWVAPFDAATVEEAFDLYALLSARSSGQAATRGDPDTLARLETVHEAIRSATGPDEFEPRAREFRRVVNLSVAGPHMRALLRSFSGLVPVGSRIVLAGTMKSERVYIDHELEAIRAGQAEVAAAAVTDHIHMIGRRVVAALRDRGVFEPASSEDGSQPWG